MVLGLNPPGALTLLTLALFFCSSFWFYYINPNELAFIFSYYIKDHSKDYYQLIDLDSIVQTMRIIIPLELIIFIIVLVVSLFLGKWFGKKNDYFQIILYVITIPYAVISQALLFLFDIFIKYEQFYWISNSIGVLIVTLSILSSLLFIKHSLDYSEIKPRLKKLGAISSTFILCVLMFIIAIKLPYQSSIGNISNVEIEVPDTLRIKLNKSKECDILFYVTIKNKKKYPLAVINPSISSINIYPDPRHEGLKGYSSNQKTHALHASSNNSQAFILNRTV